MEMALAVTGAPRGGMTLSPTFVLAFVALAAALNLVGGYLAGLFRLPIFLDSIGTAIAAFVLGPWWGALAGVLANGAGSIWYGPTNALFAPVSIAAALVWGYGVRGWGLGRTPVRFFALNVLVALVVSVAATPIVVWLGGGTGHPSDVITAAFARLGPWGAVFADNVLVSLVDKVLTGYIALAVVQALPPHLIQGGAVLPGSAGNRWILVAVTGLLIGGVLLATLAALRAAGA